DPVSILAAYLLRLVRRPRIDNDNLICKAFDGIQAARNRLLLVLDNHAQTDRNHGAEHSVLLASGFCLCSHYMRFFTGCASNAEELASTRPYFFAHLPLHAKREYCLFCYTKNLYALY